MIRPPLLTRSTAAALVLGAVLSASAPPERPSVWTDRQLTMDGSGDEWGGLTARLGDSQVAAGFANDEAWLYLCVVASDPLTRDQIALQGLRVWFSGGGRKKDFGTRFPIPPAERDPFRRRPQAPPDEPAARAHPPAEPGVVAGEPGPQDDIELLAGGKEEGWQLPLAEAGGIAGRMAVRDEVLTYELRVPLRVGDARPYTVGAEAGQAVEIEIETPEYRGSGPRPPGGTIGIAVGGRRRGAGISGGYPMAHDARLLMKPLSVKTIVRLATAPGR